MSSSPPSQQDPTSSRGTRRNTSNSGSNNSNSNSTNRRPRQRRRRPSTPPPPPPPHYYYYHQREEMGVASTSRNEEENNEVVWPEPFVEALAIQIANDIVILSSSHSSLLSVAPTLALLFQVCSTWRAVSRSELLWENLVRIVWNRTNLTHPTWRDQYIYHHRTARNFRVYRCSYFTLHLSDHPPSPVLDEEGGVADQLPVFCTRLALSCDHLCAGFSDGSVRLFYLPSRLHMRTVRPLLRDRLGLYSRAVSGVILDVDRVVFASLDGDVHVAPAIVGHGLARRACLGDVVNDGALVDFTGCRQFWVGLYAGVPGMAFRVWDAVSEEVIFVGDSLTDSESVMGWHMLTEFRPAQFVGRVRVLADGIAIGVTGNRILLLDLNEQGVVIGEESPRRGIVVGSADASNGTFTMVDLRGMASVRRGRSLEEVARFAVAGRGAGSVSLRGCVGCMTNMYLILCVGGLIRVWDGENGEYLYSLRERLEASAIVASDQYLVASCNTTIHLWDFGA